MSEREREEEERGTRAGGRPARPCRRCSAPLRPATAREIVLGEREGELLRRIHREREEKDLREKKRKRNGGGEEAS